MSDLTSTASGTVSLLPLGKEEVARFAQKLREDVMEGNVNAMALKAYLKSLNEAYSQIDDVLGPMARAEAEKYGAKTFEYKGMKIELAELGTKYDFSNCKDPEYTRIMEQVARLDQRRKDREVFLKGIKGKLEIMDPETAEVVTIYPPVKTSTSGLKMSLV